MSPCHVGRADTGSEFSLLPYSEYAAQHIRFLTKCRLKCNRSHPCENCIRRGDASSCSYAAPGTRKKNQSQGATSPDDMQNRIDRLEGLVLSLMTNGAQSAGPAAAAAAISRSQSDSAGSSSFPFEIDKEDDDMIKEEDEDEESDVEGVTNSLGVLKVDTDKGKSLYFGDSHWHLVLADVSFKHVSSFAFSRVLSAFIWASFKHRPNPEYISESPPTSICAGLRECRRCRIVYRNATQSCTWKA